jgi:hypothetical protein
MNNDFFEKTAGQAVAFQKIWMESWSKMVQATLTLSPASPPPEMLRQARNGIFRALSESWEDYMRSPQFLDGMRQWTENTITFRKWNNDCMGRVWNELQSPSREDIDTVMLTTRHFQKRLLDRLDELAEKVDDLNRRASGGASAGSSPAKTAGRRPTQPKKSGTGDTEIGEAKEA